MIKKRLGKIRSWGNIFVATKELQSILSNLSLKHCCYSHSVLSLLNAQSSHHCNLPLHVWKTVLSDQFSRNTRRQTDVLLGPLSSVRLKDKFQGFCVTISTAVLMRVVIMQIRSKTTTVSTSVGLATEKEVRGIDVWRHRCMFVWVSGSLHRGLVESQSFELAGKWSLFLSNIFYSIFLWGI